MTDFSIVEDWLDRWEEWRGGSVDEFVARHLQSQPAALIEEFRRQVRKLAAIDRELASPAAGTPAPDAAAADTARDDLAPGSEPVPGYRLEARLGRGGFGEVWRAAGPGGFPVALKFVRLGQAAARAERRALDAIRDVRHPHLLSVFGAWDAGPWLVIGTELADRSLSARLAEARAEGHPGIPPTELVRYMTDAADALDHLNGVGGPAGTRGVQHRDVKPPNLLLVGGRLMVGDFGLARVQDRTEAGHTGSMTHAYAPPEFFDRKTSARSDQYSLAVTYCELRGGRLPFTGSPVEVMRGHLEGEPELSMVPAAEQPAVRRALAKSPADRWPSCRAFVDAVAGDHAAPVREGPTGIAAPGRGGRPRWAVATAAVVAVAVAVTGSWVALRPGASPPADPGIPPATPITAPLPAGVVAVTVLDFENHSKDPHLDGFKLGLRDMLMTDLSRIGTVRVTERARIGAVLGEHDLAKAGGFIDPATATPAGRGVAARVLLTGGFVVTGDDIRVDVRLVSVETGVVAFADAVAGTKADFAGLQKALTDRVVAGLKVDLTDVERAALGRPATGDFEAFRLYAAARLARERDQVEAGTLLREALARDPGFGLARRDLGDLEAAALTRLADDDRRRLERAGEVGRALLARREQLRAAVEAGDRTPGYFAALIALSAHAGLLGDAAREADLLARYWAEFAAAIPAADAARVGAEVNRLVRAEGKTLQELVDGGDYSTFLDDFTDPNAYLKPELRGKLRWPRYAAIWPFDFDAREAFRVATNDQGVKVDPGYFEKALPRLPHDYLRRLFVPDSGFAGGPRLRLLVSVAGYYSRGPAPAGEGAAVSDVQKALLESLDRVGAAGLDPALTAEAAAVLDAVGATAADPDSRRLANALLVRLARPGTTPAPRPAPPAADSRPAGGRVFGLTLDGPRVVLIVHRETDAADVWVGGATKQLAGAIGALPDGVELDVLLTGQVKKGVPPSLFGGPRRLTPADRKAAVALIEGLPATLDAVGDDPRRPLADTLADTVQRWGTAGGRPGQILVVGFTDDVPPAPVRPIALGSKGENRPRVLYAGAGRIDWLGRLVRDSEGAAVLLEEGDLHDLKLRRWDVTQIR